MFTRVNVALVAGTSRIGMGMLIVEYSALYKFVVNHEKNNSYFYLCNVKAEKLTFMSIIYARMFKVLFLFIPQNHFYKVQKEDIFCYQVKH